MSQPEGVRAYDPAYLRQALEKITRKQGRYSRDHLEHCGNTVDDMAQVAERALEGTWEPDEP